ncbi:MAG: 2-dehydropantoate 2-reductase [Spirochaetes bacterium]|nr:2-dehydropantoate 2-reductase [Spirochaetota bacterium]MBN2771089.1 2-dehydropantoate 2-reductase [Spirochaetota bacterium]
MNVGIIGIGGVGGYFGGKIAKELNEREDMNIYFAARGLHLQAIKKNGLLLDTDDGTYVSVPTEITDDISQLPELDICLICVKSYDLQNVLEQLKPKIKRDTIILPLLNGVDIYDRVRSVICDGAVFPACVYVGTHIEKPGKVVQRGGACIIHFGVDPGKEAVTNWLPDLLDQAGICYNMTSNPFCEIWSKYMFIASFGLVCACYNKTIGEVMQSNELADYVIKIMSEIFAISKKAGIDLPADIVKKSFAKGGGFPFDTKTSFQRDYENRDKPDERDLFGETLLRLGKKYNEDTSTVKMIYDMINNDKEN